MYFRGLITVFSCTKHLSNIILSSFTPRRRSYWASSMWLTI